MCFTGASVAGGADSAEFRCFVVDICVAVVLDGLCAHPVITTNIINETTRRPAIESKLLIIGLSSAKWGNMPPENGCILAM